MSKSRLSQLERGERALDRRSEIVALAGALEVAPTELLALPLPLPADGRTDMPVEAIRRALLAAVTGAAGGEVLAAQVPRSRVTEVLDAQQACHHDTAGALLRA
jgi:transcriptional regulator with XRE-family HTH domain